MSTNSKILVFIPTYRCENQIQRVIAQFDKQVQLTIHTVLIVDNRSPDSTLAAAIARAKDQFEYCNFIAWLNDENYGLGGSHKAALGYAIDNDFDYLVVLHGDDQADIHDLVPILESKAYQHVDCLLGARFMSGSNLLGYSWIRSLGNRVYNKLFSLVTLNNIYDLGSGLNMYRIEPLKNLYYRYFPDDLTFNYVMLLASYNQKQKVRFFPILWREEDQVSNVRLVRQAIKVLNLLAGYFVQRGTFLQNDLRESSTRFENYTGTIQYRYDANKNDK